MSAQLLLAASVIVTVFLVYLPTLAPTISWSNGGADSGDLAAAVVTLGVPHPPGYPAYTLLGRAWTMLPLGGDPAYRLNLLSAACAALAAGLSAAAIFRLSRDLRLEQPTLAVGAALGGLTLAFAPLVWSQATIAEVYAPGLAVLSLLNFVALGWRRRITAGNLALGGLIGGLGFGVLPQIALLGPGALALLLAGRGWRRPAASRLTAGRLAALLGGAAAGLTVFMYLPLSASVQPTLRWGDPTSLPAFWTVVTAEQYRYLAGTLSPADWPSRLLDSLALLGRELSPVGLGLAALGVAALWRQERVALAALSTLVALNVLFRTSYPAAGNEVYLLPALYGLALLAGVGSMRLVAAAQASRGRAGAMLLAVALFGLLGLRAAATLPAVDASNDRRAERFARQTLAALPPGALLISDRDETTFSLWYRQALGERPDVVVIDSRLLFRDWYQAQLARRYPDLDPAAVRPAGLTALGRPVYLLVGPAGEEVARSV